MTHTRRSIKNNIFSIKHKNYPLCIGVFASVSWLETQMKKPKKFRVLVQKNKRSRYRGCHNTKWCESHSCCLIYTLLWSQGIYGEPSSYNKVCVFHFLQETCIQLITQLRLDSCLVFSTPQWRNIKMSQVHDKVIPMPWWIYVSEDTCCDYHEKCKQLSQWKWVHANCRERNATWMCKDWVSKVFIPHEQQQCFMIILGPLSIGKTNLTTFGLPSHFRHEFTNSD